MSEKYISIPLEEYEKEQKEYDELKLRIEGFENGLVKACFWGVNGVFSYEFLNKDESIKEMELLNKESYFKISDLEKQIENSQLPWYERLFNWKPWWKTQILK